MNFIEIPELAAHIISYLPAGHLHKLLFLCSTYYALAAPRFYHEIVVRNECDAERLLLAMLYRMDRLGRAHRLNNLADECSTLHRIFFLRDMAPVSEDSLLRVIHMARSAAIGTRCGPIDVIRVKETLTRVYRLHDIDELYLLKILSRIMPPMSWVANRRMYASHGLQQKVNKTVGTLVKHISDLLSKEGDDRLISDPIKLFDWCVCLSMWMTATKLTARRTLKGSLAKVVKRLAATCNQPFIDICRVVVRSEHWRSYRLTYGSLALQDLIESSPDVLSFTCAILDQPSAIWDWSGLCIVAQGLLKACDDSSGVSALLSECIVRVMRMALSPTTRIERGGVDVAALMLSSYVNHFLPHQARLWLGDSRSMGFPMPGVRLAQVLRPSFGSSALPVMNFMCQRDPVGWINCGYREACHLLPGYLAKVQVNTADLYPLVDSFVYRIQWRDHFAAEVLCMRAVIPRIPAWVLSLKVLERLPLCWRSIALLITEVLRNPYEHLLQSWDVAYRCLQRVTLPQLGLEPFWWHQAGHESNLVVWLRNDIINYFARVAQILPETHESSVLLHQVWSAFHCLPRLARDV